nr:ATP-dependent helicase [Stutzerimonas stutzeri]
LKQRFEHRVVKGLKGGYMGPKNLKASGKAAGTKKKKDDKKNGGDKKAKPAGKPTAKRPKNAKREAPASQVVSSDGMAPLRRKKPEGH